MPRRSRRAAPGAAHTNNTSAPSSSSSPSPAALDSCLLCSSAATIYSLCGCPGVGACDSCAVFFQEELSPCGQCGEPIVLEAPRSSRSRNAAAPAAAAAASSSAAPAAASAGPAGVKSAPPPATLSFLSQPSSPNQHPQLRQDEGKSHLAVAERGSDPRLPGAVGNCPVCFRLVSGDGRSAVSLVPCLCKICSSCSPPVTRCPACAQQVVYKFRDFAFSALVTELAASLEKSERQQEQNGGGDDNSNSNSFSTPSSPINVADVDFDCCICLCPATDPMVTKCGHFGCAQCLNASMERSELCPVCRAPCKRTQLLRIFGKGVTPPTSRSPVSSPTSSPRSPSSASAAAPPHSSSSSASEPSRVCAGPCGMRRLKSFFGTSEWNASASGAVCISCKVLLDQRRQVQEQERARLNNNNDDDSGDDDGLAFCSGCRKRNPQSYFTHRQLVRADRFRKCKNCCQAEVFAQRRAAAARREEERARRKQEEELDRMQEEREQRERVAASAAGRGGLSAADHKRLREIREMLFGADRFETKQLREEEAAILQRSQARSAAQQRMHSGNSAPAAASSAAATSSSSSPSRSVSAQRSEVLAQMRAERDRQLAEEEAAASSKSKGGSSSMSQLVAEGRRAAKTERRRKRAEHNAELVRLGLNIAISPSASSSSSSNASIGSSSSSSNDGDSDDFSHRVSIASRLSAQQLRCAACGASQPRSSFSAANQRTTLDDAIRRCIGCERSHNLPENAPQQLKDKYARRAQRREAREKQEEEERRKRGTASSLPQPQGNDNNGDDDDWMQHLSVDVSSSSRRRRRAYVNTNTNAFTHGQVVAAAMEHQRFQDRVEMERVEREAREHDERIAQQEEEERKQKEALAAARLRQQQAEAEKKQREEQAAREEQARKDAIADRKKQAARLQNVKLDLIRSSTAPGGAGSSSYKGVSTSAAAAAAADYEQDDDVYDYEADEEQWYEEEEEEEEDVGFDREAEIAICSVCRMRRPFSAFSKAQIKKGPNFKERVCLYCRN